MTSNDNDSTPRLSGNGTTTVQSAIPKRRHELLKWNGWGYRDSAFRVNERNIIEFTGNRYPIGEKELPHFTKWVLEVFNIDLTTPNRSQPLPKTFPEPRVTKELLEEIKNLRIDYSVDGIDRLVRAHGHLLREVYILKQGSFKRIPDVILWPKCHEDVVEIVKFCAKNGLVCVPFGGGTSVSGAVSCPIDEQRTIVSLDTSQMNRILWIDRENLLACFEAGIIGQDLERTLRLEGLTAGHEPDSYEFSSLGGWVATRASGMKKNVYGNIEDLVVRVRMVTGRIDDPTITLERNAQVPRASLGPDFDHTILGSEGTLGVVTQVVLKIRPQPTIVKYGSIVFPDFECGVKAMREVALQRCQPASIRLMDNEQFKFGQALRSESTWTSSILQALKETYLTRIKGFQYDQICVATLLFEGHNDQDVRTLEDKIYKIGKKFHGIPAGESNGERGYTLTFVIAYIRDLGLEHYVLSESFETSVAWNRTSALCRNVKARVRRECERYGVKHYLISCRVTQTYDAGCCIYFYMALNYKTLENPLDTYEHIEESARDEILANGGSLSHHHGVGKVRSKFFQRAVGDAAVQLYKATKSHLDPYNVFDAGNLLDYGSSKL